MWYAAHRHGWALELVKKEKAPMSATIYFRSLAARCRTSARDCFDHFAREEFHRLAHEFETRAEQLEYSTPPPSQAGWWLTRRDQGRGSEGDHGGRARGVGAV